MPPVAPTPPTPRPPADINDFNGYSDYYRSDSWGLDTIPVATFEKNTDDDKKTVHFFAKWEDYKVNPMPAEKIQEHKTHPQFSYNKLKGLGLIVGIIKYGPNKGKWIIFFDADNEKGKEAILKILGYDSVDNLKQDCVVEFHPSAPDKFHVFVLADVPLDNFTGLTTDRDKVKKNLIPGLEIKGRGSGLAYVTPSLYDGPIEGERYQLVEGSVPAPRRLFTEHEVSQWENRLEEICELYGTTSLDSSGKVPMSELLSDNFVVTKGNNRKNHVLRVGMHYLKEDEDKAEEKTKLWNEEHCDPPLSYDLYREFPDAWDWANKYHERNKAKDDNDDDADADDKKSKQRKKIISLATKLIEEQDVTWFHDEYQTAYMRIKVSAHYEIYRVAKKDRKLQIFLTKLYYDATGDIIKEEDLKEVIRRLEGNGLFSGVLKKIHLRKCWQVDDIDQHTGREIVNRNMLFYDMCSDVWNCIMVDGENDRWDLLPHQPEHITFYRYQQLPQAVPNRDYTGDPFEEWFAIMHITNPKDKLLLKVWCVAAFLPDQPHPMLIPDGPPGGGKSTFCRQLQIYIDPYAGEALILPHEKNELAQQAHHRALLIYDNVEYDIPKWLSDLLCQLITSANVSKRQLYTDDTDFAYVLMRSVVLNGLQIPRLKPDALDRTIVIHFERIPDEQRKNLTEVDDSFRKLLPKLLGKTFDVLARSLKIYKDMPELTRKPRMADFASRGSAIARAFAELEGKNKEQVDAAQKDFLDAYEDIMERQNIDAVEANSTASALIRWHNEYLKTGKEGNDSKTYETEKKTGMAPGDLLNSLTVRAKEMGFDVKDKEWPKKPNQFTHELYPLLADIKHGYKINVHIFRDTKGEFTTKNSTWIEISEVVNNDGSGNSAAAGEGGGSGGTGGTTGTGAASDSSNGASSKSNVKGDKAQEKSSSENRDNLGQTTSTTSTTSTFSKTSVKSEENGGDGGGGEVGASPPPPPPKQAQIERGNAVGGDGGDGGDTFAKKILFTQEDSSKNPQPSLIDDIKQYALALDPEWDNRPGMDDRLLQFNFYDSQGKNWVININRDCNGSEALLLEKADQTIRNYKVVLTYFEKGDKLGFSKWDKRARANKKVSPIDMGKRKDHLDACIRIANKDHQPIKDIDLGLVYQKPIIENFLENIYLSNELDEVAKALLGEGKLEGISGEYFVDLSLEQQVAYGMKDAELTYRLAGAKNYAVLSVLERIGQSIVGGKYADLVKMCDSGPTQWWGQIFRKKFNTEPSTTALKPTGKEGELKGGHVEDINEIKEYRWVVIFDFRGQYPSIISKYNLCFTTCCCSCCKDNPDARVKTGLPEVDNNGWWFCRRPENRGIVPQIVDALVDMRNDYKKKMKAAEKVGDKDAAQQYNIMQYACKLMANSIFGVFGEKHWEYADLRVANTITGFGRAKVIKMGEKIAQDYPGLKSVYHDTDSAFILGLEPTELEPVLDSKHAIVKDIVDKISAPEGEGGGGLGLPLEYKKCYKKVMIKASKNYMGLNVETEKIETVGLVGKKRNQCKLVRAAFEQQREYWKDDVSDEIVEEHIKQLVWQLDNKAVPLEQLQEKNTIQADPWTGYKLKAQNYPSCYLGRKHKKRKGESTPPYYLAIQQNDGDLWYTEDPSQISHDKYKVRLRTALSGMLAVRNYSKANIDQMLGLVKPKKRQ